MTNTCKKHPRYKGVRRPKDCAICFDVWARLHKVGMYSEEARAKAKARVRARRRRDEQRALGMLVGAGTPFTMG